MTGRDPTTSVVTLGTNWLAVALAFASASGIVLSLLGYGVALSMGSSFGMPHTFTFNSALDLFVLGSWAIAQFLEGLGGSNWDIYQSALQVAGRASWPFAIALVVAPVLVWTWLLASRRLSLEASSRKNRALAIRFKRKVARSPSLLTCIWWLVSTLVVSVAIPLTAIATAVVTVLFCTLLAVLPGMGMVAGKSYIDKWVVGPVGCSKLRTRAHRLVAGNATVKESVASCLAVVQPDGKVVKGRLVFSTSTSVVLFDPNTGRVQRLDIAGSNVTVIGNLDD